MYAGKLNLRCFIDGLEVPVIGARCTYTEGAAATAQVQLVATDAVYGIPARSFVTLFVYDNHDFETDNSGVPREKKLGPNDLRRWKLLFAGEKVGIQVTKSDQERHAVMVCADHTTYWDFIKQHYVNFSNGGVELFENAFLGVDAREVKNFDVVTKDAQSNIFVWLSESQAIDPETKKPASSLYLGAHRLLREMFFASNNFYAQAFNRLRIGDQIVGLPLDQTAGRLLKLDFFEKFIKNQIGGAGGLVSLRDLLQTMLGNVFHTYVTVPFPWLDYTGQARGMTVELGKSAKKADQELGKVIIQRETYPNASLNYTIIKPDTTFLVPPACNIVFPHQYNTVTYQRNELEEPTRLFLRTSLIFTGQDKWLTERFYAPDFEVFNQLLYQQGGYLKRMASVLLPHEEFTGPNPIEAWQNDIAAFVQKGARREYLAKLADYLFWKYRFATRTLNASMPLNLDLVPGYPGLIMEGVGPRLSITKHWLGHIQTLVHSVDQAGGWTHVTMTGARLHDENIDFDEKGRTLEEITSRGADGFLDDRYDVERIGRDVYKVLFGVGSLVDFRGLVYGADNTTDEEGGVTTNAAGEVVTFGIRNDATLRAEVESITSPVTRAIAELQILYRTAVDNSLDIEQFAKSLTTRPKANLVEIMGVPSATAPGSFDQDHYAAIANLYAELEADGTEVEGFLSTAVDPNASDMANDEFASNETKVVYQRVEQKQGTDVVETRMVAGEGFKKVTIKAPTTSVLRPVEVPSGDKSSYKLKALLESRQKFVQAYIDSLRDRGLRG